MFPDQHYLAELVQRQQSKVEGVTTIADQLRMTSGTLLNWVADFMLDPNIQWERRVFEIDSLTLTGTNPEWNAILLEQCHRSPLEFRQLLQERPVGAHFFASAEPDTFPILVRRDGDAWKVLDGMHRVIAAIRDGKTEIEGFAAVPNGPVQAACEPHVVYDVLRAFERGGATDRDGLIAALQFLRRAYTNVDELLRERFNPQWIRDDRLSPIIAEVLK